MFGFSSKKYEKKLKGKLKLVKTKKLYKQNYVK